MLSILLIAWLAYLFGANKKLAIVNMKKLAKY